MTPADKRLVRIDEYRAMALAATRLSADSPLGQVKAKHDRAAAVWTKLADGEESRDAEIGKPR